MRRIQLRCFESRLHFAEKLIIGLIQKKKCFVKSSVSKYDYRVDSNTLRRSE